MPPAAHHRIHAGVERDLAEAIEYLEREAPEQTTRLRRLFVDAGQRLTRRPLLYATLYEDYRRVVLVPFKYAIVYSTNGRDTDILAVIHTQRDPDALKAELRGRTF